MQQVLAGDSSEACRMIFTSGDEEVGVGVEPRVGCLVCNCASWTEPGNVVEVFEDCWYPSSTVENVA